MKFNKYILMVMALVALPFMARAASDCNGYSAANCQKQGGGSWVVGGTQAVRTGGSFTVESGGTLAIDSGATFTNGGAAIPVIRVAQDAVASGQTSKAVTVTGITAASKCIASPNEVATNAAYIRAVVPTADTATVTVSADPGASNLDITVVCAD